MAFDAFEGQLTDKQHFIPVEQLRRSVGRAALNTPYLVSMDALLIDIDGGVFLEPTEYVFGEEEDAHPLEEFILLEDPEEPLIIIRTEEGFVADASIALDGEFDFHDWHVLTSEEKLCFAKVIAFVETTSAAEALYRAMAEKYGVEFDDQVNSLIAALSSLQREDDN